ncbi:hypothetical protein GOP47_0023740 [Adiantum capillus-veneris]|uniref:Remorin C-terminal domain-containing protein n=1 Tax=Adiantum capillus-veneris TaxID=13818 RepID=A0A9D4U4J6_ADICA|nr:hypothetical protein GOP47_0023740 [Adiantum capillus-veneris]
MTMKYKGTDSSSSSLSSSSSCTSDGNAMDVNNPSYKKSLVSTVRKAKSRKGKTSSELEPNSSTDDDGSPGSICNKDSSFQKEKQSAQKLERRDAEVLAGKDSALLKPEWPAHAETFEKKAWTINSKQAKSQAQHEVEMKQEQEGATDPMDKEVPNLQYVRKELPHITLVKSNSVSATKADNILKLDYISASSNSHHAHNHKLQGHRLSTGDSPLNMQKRYGSQGPAFYRTTGFPSPGTPSRSSFSGVPTSLMLNNKANYYNMVGRIAVNDANGKLLPLYSLPPCCDQDANLIPGRLSVGFSSRAAGPPPSKWDDAEKWLVNASPSHPSQPPSKQPANYILNEATNTNPYVAEGKKSIPSVNKRVLNDVVVSSHSPVDDHHHYANKQLAYNNAHTLNDHHQQSGFNAANYMSMHDSYIQSRSLVPLASSSSDGHVQEDGGASGAMSDSELSNTQEEFQSAFVRSASHRQGTDGKHKNHTKKGQLIGRKDRTSAPVRKEELVISSPVSLQLERLKLGNGSSHLNDQLPKMHDVYAVETTRNAGPCVDETTRVQDVDVASSSMTRLVVQAGKVVGRWGAGAMRDASTDVSPKMSMSRRDMGTQMTPVASCKTSRAGTPRKSGSPARHNTPTVDATSGTTADRSLAKATEAAGCQVAKSESGHVSGRGGSDSSVSNTDSTTSSSWKSLQESLISASEHPQQLKPHFDEYMQESLKVDNPQYSAWEEAERSKHMTKCAREEARIDAWESHQKAKAEAELKKLEMKLERLRAQATEKIMNKVATAHLRAEEMRATARAQQAEQLAKALERANSINRKGGGYFSESLGVCFSIMP